MIAKVFGKSVSARSVRDKVQFVGRHRIQRRRDGFPSGIANRFGRQAFVHIRVERMIQLQILKRQPAFQLHRSVGHGVNDGRIGL